MKFSFPNSIAFFFVALIITSCGTEKAETVQFTAFTNMTPETTKITFSNDLTENDSLNYFTYAYIYMGGGVSAGDINNDGLIDLYFTGNMVSNKLYLNKGNLQFEDITDAAGIGGDDRWYTGTTMIDINCDGFLDIYCSVGGKFGPKENQLFINNGDNTFAEKASEYGIDDPSNSVQATFFDYDLDGDLDLYVANYPPTAFNAPNFHYAFKQKNPDVLDSDRLYRNDGGNNFVEATAEAGLKTFGLSLSATVGDVNQDGWPDIYISNDFSSPDYLFINNQDGTFTDRVKEVTNNTSFYGMGVDIADFNNDDLLDIIQVDMTSQINRRAKANMASMNPSLFWSTVNSGFHYQYMQNSLQMNNGIFGDQKPHFSNMSRLAGLSSTDWSWGPLIADLNNDAWKDIFISNGTRREINNRDFFRKIEKEGVHPDSMLAKSLAIPSEKIENYVFENNKDLTFEQRNKDWGFTDKTFSNGCVYADLDNDGDLEIVVNNIDGLANVYQNNGLDENNFVSIHFEGSKNNPLGLGAKVKVYADGIAQFQELTMTRGFQSSVPPIMHFGIGKAAAIDSVTVVWTDGKRQTLKDIAANQQLTLAYSKAIDSTTDRPIVKHLFNTVVAGEDLLKHIHRENPYDDFENEVLLPHKTSMFGPNVATGDIDNDGKEDVVIGGSSRFNTAVYLQKDEAFERLESDILNSDMVAEDMGIHLFDADKDGDLDLYVASGGNEFAPNSKPLQDRFYVNDGNGNFQKSNSALPEMLTSSSRVHSHDYDKDGDLDLFVGGRLVPGNYPSPTDSYILENVSANGEVKFENVTSDKAPDLKKLGMVTDAVWSDFDGDGWTDLIVVGEWMPIVVLKNERGSFKNVSDSRGVEDTRGWWFSIAGGDFDNDGDEDYIVGNLGLNYKYKANEEETFDIYFNDFDNNSKNDIVLSYYNQGEKYPVRGRECSSQQIPAIKSKFKDYESFSIATLEDVYTKEELDKSLHYQVKSFASVYLENTKEGFVIHTLPNLAQMSCINKILVEDYNRDGHLDAIIAGNLYASEVETPRNDAGVGLVLLGNGKGDLEAIPSRESGLLLTGDVKDLGKIQINDQEYFIAVKNSDAIQFFEVLD